MTMTGKRAATGAGLVLILLAGCGGDGDADDTAATASPTTEAAATATETSDAVATQEPGAGSESPADQQSSPEDGQERYVIEEGDTLTSIAERFDTTVDEIVEANDLDDPDVIIVGEELRIPQQ